MRWLDVDGRGRPARAWRRMLIAGGLLALSGGSLAGDGPATEAASAPAGSRHGEVVQAVQAAGSAAVDAGRKTGRAARQIGHAVAASAVEAASAVAGGARKVYGEVREGVKEAVATRREGESAPIEDAEARR